MSGKAVAALAAVFLAGGGVALLLTSADDEKDETSAQTQDTSTGSAPKTQTTEEKKEEPKKDEEPASDDAQVEEVVVQYVEQASQSETVECDLVVDDVCVQNESDIDLSAVEQFLNELEVKDVTVVGDQAKAELNRGGSFNLQREGGKWKISGFEPPSRPDRSGGIEAPQKPDLPQRGGGAKAP